MYKTPRLAYALITTAFLGCHSGPFSKRQSELCCPTDIRQTIKWSFGEDAVMKPPCGISPGAFYGHKPTAWRDWPGTANEWRNTHGLCGLESIHDDRAADAEVVYEDILPEESAADADVPVDADE